MDDSDRSAVEGRPAAVVGLAVAGVGLAIQLGVNLSGGYGFFRDEFYYVACSKHLDWGFVDQPPLAALVLAGVRLALGESLFALRLLPAVAFFGLILLTGFLAMELGGGRRAVLVATSAALVSPSFLGISGFYSMNAFDLVAWAACLLVFLKILNGGSERLWLLFGLVAGIAFENKVGIAFLCGGLAVGLLLTRHREKLKSRQLWIGLGIAVLLAASYVLWQFFHDFATLEFMRNAAEHKNAPMNPLAFLVGQLVEIHPLNILVWVPGLLFLLFARRARPFRPLGLAYLVIFLAFALQNGKPYYLAAYCPVLMAAGGLAIERVTARRGLRWAHGALVALLFVGGTITLPFALPVLSPERFLQYSAAIGFSPGGEERDQSNKMGQHYSDMFGWKEMAETVARVFHSLTPEDQARAVIYAQNYGEAGAVDYFGPALGLPGAICGHNNYWIWGPGDRTGDVMIIIGGRQEDHAPHFDRCEIAAVHSHPCARSFETDLSVFICRGAKFNLREIWPSLRSYI